MKISKISDIFVIFENIGYFPSLRWRLAHHEIHKAEVILRLEWLQKVKPATCFDSDLIAIRDHLDDYAYISQTWLLSHHSTPVSILCVACRLQAYEAILHVWLTSPDAIATVHCLTDNLVEQRSPTDNSPNRLTFLACNNKTRNSCNSTYAKPRDAKFISFRSHHSSLEQPHAI